MSYEITTYEELNSVLTKFENGHFSFITITSRGGLGKTTSTTSVLSDYYLFTGHISPYSLFLNAERHKEKVIVFDDVDTLLESKTNVALLKQICDTKSRREVMWHSTRGGEDFSKRFVSESRVVLLSNDLRVVNDDLRALMDRSINFVFNPSVSEVLGKAQGFLDDDIVIQYVQSKKDLLQGVSLRDLVKSSRLRCAGLRWKEYLMSNNQSDIGLAKRLADECKTQKEAIEKFKELTGKSRRTFYNYLKK